MKQNPVKHISQMPAAIAKFEKDLQPVRTRTETAFPDILKLPIVSASVPQPKECNTELQGKDYVLPDFPANPKDDAEKGIKEKINDGK